MINEINNQDKILKLQKIIDEFLDNFDCRGIKCSECKHDKLCEAMRNLDLQIRRHNIIEVEE